MQGGKKGLIVNSRHLCRIPAELVARNQRERLIAAIAEVCAERGYAEASVARVAKTAGVSSVTFYEQFADRRDCLLAAHRELQGRLLDELDRVAGREDTPEARARATLRAAGVLAAIGKRVVAGEAARLPQLEGELRGTLSAQS